jgi:hypothetical protein
LGSKKSAIYNLQFAIPVGPHVQARLPGVRRAPGSEWLKDHPRLLELAYTLSKQVREVPGVRGVHIMA